MVINGKAANKRRRVSFSEEITEHHVPRSNNTLLPRSSNSALRDTPLVDVSGAAGIPEHSLLTIENASKQNAAVTAFDIAEDIEEGAIIAGDDGVIPSTLQRRVITESDAADVSSSDEEEAPKEPEKAENDAWADGLVTMPVSNMKTTPKNDAKRRRTNTSALSLSACVVRFARLLKTNETAARSMRRLKTEQNKDHLNSLIDACHNALTHGILAVYDTFRPQLLGIVKWDLCWGVEPTENSEIHRELEASQMLAWENAGYFDGERKAWVRPSNAVELPWMEAKATFGGSGH